MARHSFASVCTTFGYISLTLQWLWLSVLFMPLLLDSTLFTQLSSPPETRSDVTVPELFTPLSYIVAGIAIVLALGVGLFAAIKAPTVVTKRAEKITYSSAQHFAPKLLHHKKITKKQRRTLNRRVQLAIKLLLSIVAFVGLLGTFLINVIPLTPSVIFSVGFFLLPWTLLWFGMSYALSGTKNTV